MTDTAQIQKAFVVDGKIFASQKEANEYLRRPKIFGALQTFIVGNDDLANWILDNQEGIEMAFEVGTVKRVTKRETGQLEKSLEAIVASGNPAFDFVAKNADAIKSSFRWPSVKRMDDEEKAAAALEALVALAEGNNDLAQFIVQNKDNILEAFKAGTPKRAVSEKAKEGLARYRAEAAARRAEKEAAEA